MRGILIFQKSNEFKSKTELKQIRPNEFAFLNAFYATSMEIELPYKYCTKLEFHFLFLNLFFIKNSFLFKLKVISFKSNV